MAVKQANLAIKPLRLILQASLAVKPLRLILQPNLAVKPLKLILQANLAVKPMKLILQANLAVKPLRLILHAKPFWLIQLSPCMRLALTTDAPKKLFPASSLMAVQTCGFMRKKRKACQLSHRVLLVLSYIWHLPSYFAHDACMHIKHLQLSLFKNQGIQSFFHTSKPTQFMS